MKATIRMKCILCGKTIRPGNTGGIPNGLGFQMKSGNLYNVCSECVSYRAEEATDLIEQLEEKSCSET